MMDYGHNPWYNCRGWRRFRSRRSRPPVSRFWIAWEDARSGGGDAIRQAGRANRTAFPVARDGWLGCMRDRTTIVGDIVSPASDPSDWDVLRQT